MRETIGKVLLDRSLQLFFIKKCFKQVKYFSWEKTVKQTYQLYCKITNTLPRLNLVQVIIILYRLTGIRGFKYKNIQVDL